MLVMEVNARFNINSAKLIMHQHGLENMGSVQRFIDSEVIRLMGPYTPFRTGSLERSAIISTVIGSGKVRQNTPYARYLYYGEVYGPNLPIRNGKISFNEADGPIERWVSPKKKSPTGRGLKYDTSAHPLAGKRWFERMVADHKDEILNGARKIAGGKG